VVEGAFLLVTMALFPDGIVGLLALARDAWPWPSPWRPAAREPVPVPAETSRQRSGHV
jgi:hypothetical protein